MPHILSPIFSPTGGAFDFFVEEAVRHRPQADKPCGRKLILSGMTQPQHWTASILHQADNES
jgi:hypothetical protein